MVCRFIYKVFRVIQFRHRKEHQHLKKVTREKADVTVTTMGSRHKKKRISYDFPQTDGML
jgi:hypothetical protein